VLRRRAVLPLVVLAAATAAAIPLAGMAAPSGNDLPDLRADPPANPYLEVYSDGRLLLRFDGFVTNVGTGPLDITGNPNGTMWQRVNDGGTLVNDHTVPVQYETADGHNHFHLMRIMRYSLWNSSKTAEVAPGQKVGFCLYDYNQATSFNGTRDPQVYALGRRGDDFCRRGNPGATDLNMGVSSGWRDDYGGYLALQWVDVSDTSPGSYYIAADADPNGIIRESNEINARAYASFTFPVPGYVPRQIGPVTASGNGTTAIPLQSDAFGSPGSVVYRILSQPGRGSVALNGNTAVYTASPGLPGTYSFTYSASQSGSPYPRTPRTATVTLNVGTSQATAVTMSGAPSSLTAGTSAQLAATVVNAGQGVTWTASAGTISPSGLYVAPSTPPPGGDVTVRATSTQVPSAFSEAVIHITPAPPVVPAPSRPNAGGSSAGALLTGPRLLRKGRTIVVRTTPKAQGTLTITAVRGGNLLARCTSKVRYGTHAVCKLVLPRHDRSRPVKVVVGLRAGGTRAVLRAVAKA
jgi:hypothetical protein